MPKKQTQYSAKWQASNIERIILKPNLKYNLSGRIQAQIDKGKAKSRQDYIIQAILRKLEEDEKE